MKFQRQQVIQGNRLKKEAEENPGTFGTENGAAFSQPSQGLDKKNATRFAGPGGAFAMQMQQDPELQARVAKWDQEFAQSNEGMQFNQAKMTLMGGGLPFGERQANDMSQGAT